MAEHYVSDDEQVEAIRRWWKANGTGIIVGIVLGVTAVLAWQYWKSYQADQAEQASLYFDVLRQAVREDDSERVAQQVQKLREEYPDSTYAVLGALIGAKLAVEEGNNTVAAEQLEWALAQASQDELKDLARLRLTRVLLAEGQLDAAERQLDQVNNLSFTAEVEELRGDIYLARGTPDKARAAYEAARAAAGNTGGGAMLQLKLDNLTPPRANQEN